MCESKERYRERNEAYDMLRGIWIILIFVCHWSLMYSMDERLGIALSFGGGYGVAGFFVLSGFLINQRYHNSFEDNLSLSKLIHFVLSRMKKLYLLHILCMLPYLCNDFPQNIAYFMEGNKAWQNFVIEYGLNLLLLQSIFPNVGSINGVSWFLSCIMLLYIVTPFVIKFKNRLIKNGQFIKSGMMLCLVALYVLDKLWWSYDNPTLRIFQYIFGMLLSDMVFQKK